MTCCYHVSAPSCLILPAPGTLFTAADSASAAAVSAALAPRYWLGLNTTGDTSTPAAAVSLLASPSLPYAGYTGWPGATSGGGGLPSGAAGLGVFATPDANATAAAAGAVTWGEEAGSSELGYVCKRCESFVVGGMVP